MGFQPYSLIEAQPEIIKTRVPIPTPNNRPPLFVWLVVMVGVGTAIWFGQCESPKPVDVVPDVTAWGPTEQATYLVLMQHHTEYAALLQAETALPPGYNPAEILTILIKMPSIMVDDMVRLLGFIRALPDCEFKRRVIGHICETNPMLDICSGNEGRRLEDLADMSLREFFATYAPVNKSWTGAYNALCSHYSYILTGTGTAYSEPTVAQMLKMLESVRSWREVRNMGRINRDVLVQTLIRAGLSRIADRLNTLRFQ